MRTTKTDQTERMRRLICVFGGQNYQKVRIRAVWFAFSLVAYIRRYIFSRSGLHLKAKTTLKIANVTHFILMSLLMKLEAMWSQANYIAVMCRVLVKQRRWFPFFFFFFLCALFPRATFRDFICNITHHENIQLYLYNFDPLKPWGLQGYTLFFLFLLNNIHCGYSLEPPRRGGSNKYQQSMFWAEIWKILEFFFWNFSFFGGKIFSIFE